jgi:hypothetical protein
MRNCVLRKLAGVEFAVWVGIDLTGSTIDDDVWNKLPDFVRDIHDGLVTCVYSD